MTSTCRRSWFPVLLAAGLVVCTLMSCGSKKGATKSNFKAAIQAELDKQPVCIITTLPYDVPSWNGQRKTDGNMEALVRAGLVKRTQMMVARSPMDAMLEDTRPKTVPGYRYEAAQPAKKYLIEVHNPMGTSTELCYGKKKVEEVVRFTEPASVTGMTASQVTYTWKLTDIADWARNPDVETHFHTDQFLNAADSPRQAQIDLVLSNDGWHFQSGF
jgi:hypothetical protein